MAKALSKSQLTAAIAEKAEITKKQAGEILEHLASLAYKHAKTPLRCRHRQARPQGPRRPHGPQPQDWRGHPIKAKRVVKFRVAKAAKDAILGTIILITFHKALRFVEAPFLFFIRANPRNLAEPVAKRRLVCGQIMKPRVRSPHRRPVIWHIGRRPHRALQTGFMPATPAARSSCARGHRRPRAIRRRPVEVILNGLRWLGLDWDECPVVHRLLPV